MVISLPLKICKHIILDLLFIFIVFPLYSGIQQAQDSVTRKTGIFSDEEIIRGERLFHGLVYLENPAMNCSGCHNTSYSDTLNWNPDAIEISRKYLHLTADDLGKVLLNPTGKKMTQVHKGFRLSPEEITLIKAYMDELSHEELTPRKIVLTNLLIFLVASLLFLFSLTDLIITKKLNFRINVVILTLTAVVITYYLVVESVNVGHSPGYAPDQPVKFSHYVHAGQNQTNCIYCHSDAPWSKTAGIPPENICMNCHLLVRNGTRSGAFEIAKVTGSFDKKVPISWTRIYNLPDHVYFNHSQHVTAGGIKCQTCHGEVQNFDIIGLSQKLTMGWCINCHRSTAIKFRENKFYSQYTNLNASIREGKANADSITIARLGGTECMKCHY